MIDIPDSFLDKDETGALVCPKCRKILAACPCPSFDPTSATTRNAERDKTSPKTSLFLPLVRFEKKGRKGKAVTLVERLPTDEAFLKELTRSFKSRIGAGGTYYVEADGGVIEVQGDHRNVLNQMLAEEGFRERVRKGNKVTR